MEIKEIKKYFENIKNKVEKAYDLANKVKKKSLDIDDKVDIPLAENMVQRVVGLISIVAPQITNTNISKRIVELEKEYGFLDWRVSLVIAEEIAKEKFCKFKNKIEAIETGIRIGLAYHTLGTVASPIEGITKIKIRKNRNNKEYLAAYFSGPIRSAGGTGASVAVLITDYIRKKNGYDKYDPTEEEIKRMITEITDYHERITNLQYFPSKEEIDFLIRNLPIQIDGDPSEKIEVSNYKDLERIETNKIRNGPCLVIGEGIAQKAPKLWKQLSKWGKDFDLEWNFLEEFLKIQKKIKAKEIKEEKLEKIKPDYTFIKDLPAGRLVLTHPLKAGGFRLRYGRSRISGYSSCSIHPATMHILNKYIATGTQLKIERPGKATALTVCDTIEGPTLELENGNVIKLESENEAKNIDISNIKKIYFLGDILISYGDFFNRAHPLIPAGYCEEWWIKELEKKTVDLFGNIDLDKLSELLEVNKNELESLLNNLKYRPNAQISINISKKLDIPLHPSYTYHWKTITKEQFLKLIKWLKQANIIKENNETIKIILPNKSEKEILGLLGIPHLANKEFVIIEKNEALSLSILNLEKIKIDELNTDNILDIINSVSQVKIRDKSGIFIGARMGRPEKAKIRRLQGSPHVLFPVGEEGDRLRSFQSALEKKKIRADFPIYYCFKCEQETIYKICEVCNKKTKKMLYCPICGIIENQCKHKASTFKKKNIDITYFFDSALKKIKMKTYPDLIKGVRGTSNKDHIPEHLIKGILRAKHDIYVNKDGTTRYDMTQIPITHFKPKEINVSIEKLKELGYNKDINGRELIDNNQIVELKPQDVILPSCPQSPDEGSDKILFRVSKFIDDLLTYYYDSSPYYNLKSEKDLIGQLIVALAPHTSAGIIGRIIGFSLTQVFFAHPMLHAATRRDCFSADTYLPLFVDGKWQIKKIGEVVDKFNPTDVVDDFGTKEIKVKGIKTIGTKFSSVKVNNFTKHMPQPMLQIKTKLGRILKTTYNHKHLIFKNEKEQIVKANKLKIGDNLAIPYKLNITKNNIKKINLLKLFSNQNWVMVRGVNNVCKKIKKYAKSYFTKRDYDNYIRRDSYPLKFILELIKKKKIKQIDKLFLSAKRDHVKIPTEIKINKELLQLIGLYIAEGYSRKVPGNLYQVYISTQDKEIRNFIIKNMANIFGLKPSENKTDRIVYSSRILYYFFISILECGSSAYEKRIPSLFLNLPNKKLGYLLSGYFEGDGSVSKSDNRITFDTVSEGLLRDLDFIFSQSGIFVKNYTYTSFPGPKVREFYIKKKREIPKFTVTKGIIQSIFVKKFSKYINFISSKKKNILNYLLKNRKPRKIKLDYNDKIVFDKITSIELLPPEISYCLNVPSNKIIVNSLLSKQCDGDEASCMLLLDTLLNFSKQYLPGTRGATQDAPLVLTYKLNPTEVDDMFFDLDVASSYPLEFYQACLEYKNPWDIKIDQIKSRLGTEKQYENLGFTHNTSNLNSGIRCSAYKTIPTMEEKLKGQMLLAEKIRAVDESDVARLVIEKHFLKDTKGNLRKFSMQKFRCSMCNQIYRRVPLIGKCTKCNGKLIFTIHEGSVVKYLEPSISLAEKYNVPAYLKQSLELLKRRIESIFGKEKEKQIGLGSWFKS